MDGISSGIIPFNVPFVAHGTKVGVFTVPCAVFIIPVRAFDFLERCKALNRIIRMNNNTKSTENDQKKDGLLVVASDLKQNIPGNDRSQNCSENIKREKAGKERCN